MLWGTSYGGAHALFVGALDPRVKGVISMVPGTGSRQILKEGGRKLWDSMLRKVTADFMERNATGVDGTMPITAPPSEPCMFPQPGVYEWFKKNAFDKPTFRNAFTLESLLRVIEYTPTAFIDLISPRPLLMLVTEHDDLVSPEQAKEAFALAGEPKRLETFPGGHFDLYDPGTLRDQAMAVQVEWLQKYFMPGEHERRTT